jgi:hypothetical protein
MGELAVDVPVRRDRVQGPSDLPRRVGAVPSSNKGAAVPGLWGVAALRLRHRVRRFTRRWWLPVLVKPDQFDIALVGRGRGREGGIRRMRGMRPEHIATSEHE